jgi:hypothetical protein
LWDRDRGAGSVVWQDERELVLEDLLSQMEDDRTTIDKMSPLMNRSQFDNRSMLEEEEELDGEFSIVSGIVQTGIVAGNRRKLVWILPLHLVYFGQLPIR